MVENPYFEENGGGYFIALYEGGQWQKIVPTQTDKYIEKKLNFEPVMPADRGEVAAFGGSPTIMIPGIGIAFQAIRLPNGKIWDSMNGWRK